MDYINFDLEIGPGTGRSYPVVVRSAAGDTRVTMQFPYDELALKDKLKDLRIALLQSSQTYRAPTPEEETVQDFGQELFTALFTGMAGTLFYESRSKATQERLTGVRLRLKILAPDLAGLPWEYLFDPRANGYLCLSRTTPVVRYPELAVPLQPLQVSPPLRILGMVASPIDQKQLDTKNDKRRMEEALKKLRGDGLVELDWLEGQTWEDLQEKLWHGPWHIFHFIGHGTFNKSRNEGYIGLDDGEGGTHFLSARDLALLLTAHQELRLVVLNSCEGAKGNASNLFSSASATLARQGIPAVLAMQEDITDRAAIQLTRTFYRAIANGLPVDAAVSEARAAISISLRHSLEWGTPVLFLRAPDSTLFTLGDTPTPPPIQTPAAPQFIYNPPATYNINVNGNGGADAPGAQGIVHKEVTTQSEPAVVTARTGSASVGTAATGAPPNALTPATPQAAPTLQLAPAAVDDEAAKEAQQSLRDTSYPAPVSGGDAESAEANQSLQDASYPATAGQLLEHARRKKASRRVITWLETIEKTTVFTSVAAIVERYRHHRAEAKAADEEQVITIAPGAPVKGGQSVSSRILITDFQHYLKGVHYPANRARLLEQARNNGATANMIARLEELDASYEFGSVGEVMRGYVFYHSMSNVRYPATRDQLLAHARSNNASRSLILWLEWVTVTVTFTTSTEAMRSFASYHLAEEEIENEVVETTPSAADISAADEATLTPAPAGRRVTTSIKITDFQRYLHGIRYPVNRAQLLERARANNAPENMIARLGELDETYTFHGVTEVMRGYVFYHYLRGVRYPATRDQLLAEARSTKATRSLLTWLEGVYATMAFSSRTEAMQSYARYKVSEAEVEEEMEEVEEEEPTITLASQVQVSEEEEDDEEEVEVEGQGSARVRRIRITEFQHYLKGTDYPADRAELLENARKNNASETMIGILEELDPTYEFTGVRDVMRGYSYHRYLYGISYPTTREKLLERARANKASSSLTCWLEGLSDTAGFASMGDVLKNASRTGGSYTFLMNRSDADW